MCETRGEDWGQGTARSRAEALRPHLGPRADVPTQPVSLPRGRRRHSGGSRTEHGALGQLKLCLPGPSVTPPPRNSCTLCPSPPSPTSFLLPQLQHCPRQPLTPTLSPAFSPFPDPDHCPSSSARLRPPHLTPPPSAPTSHHHPMSPRTPLPAVSIPLRPHPTHLLSLQHPLSRLLWVRSLSSDLGLLSRTRAPLAAALPLWIQEGLDMPGPGSVQRVQATLAKTRED